MYILILIIELVFFKIFNYNYGSAWMITTLIYIAFIAYEVLLRTNEYLDKTKVRNIIIRIMNTISGIPLENKNGKIIIKWDVIFKKLIDKKEFELYDSIVKIKTKVIDYYINQHPSLLFDSSTDMIEENHKIDLNTMIKGKKSKADIEPEVSAVNEEIAKRIYIKHISANKATFANYDSSVLIDVILNDEFEPQDYEKQKVDPNKQHDGFSVIAYYKNEKYVIVKRTMVFNKRINKEQWFFRNREKIGKSVQSIIEGTKVYEIIVDEMSLADCLTDYVDPESLETLYSIHFDCIENKMLVFNGMENGEIIMKAYCSLATNHNGFEIKLITYEIKENEEIIVKEDERIIAIGSSYQPLYTILEKMPIISNNIKLAIADKDIDSMVIK